MNNAIPFLIPCLSVALLLAFMPMDEKADRIRKEARGLVLFLAPIIVIFVFIFYKTPGVKERQELQTISAQTWLLNTQYDFRVPRLREERERIMKQYNLEYTKNPDWWLEAYKND